MVPVDVRPSDRLNFVLRLVTQNLLNLVAEIAWNFGVG